MVHEARGFPQPVSVLSPRQRRCRDTPWPSRTLRKAYVRWSGRHPPAALVFLGGKEKPGRLIGGDEFACFGLAKPGGALRRAPQDKQSPRRYRASLRGEAGDVASPAHGGRSKLRPYNYSSLEDALVGGIGRAAAETRTLGYEGCGTPLPCAGAWAVVAQAARAHAKARAQGRRHAMQGRAAIGAKLRMQAIHAQPLAAGAAFGVDALNGPAGQIVHGSPCCDRAELRCLTQA